jgi:hypothetical protein
MKDALACRLDFRETFLRTAEVADSRTSMEDIQKNWAELLGLLPFLKVSTNLGKKFPASFSVKLQRKLASTVPPRPIVHVSWEATCGQLERLCKDGAVAAEVLKYYDSHSLMVCCIPLLLMKTNEIADFRLFISGTQTTAFNLYQDITTALYLR